MAIRSSERYKVSDFVRDGYGLGDIHAELQFENTRVMGNVVDISVRGAGVEVDSPDPEFPLRFRQGEALFLKINFRDDTILVNARIAWSAATGRGGAAIVKCGLEFTVISPEDTLKLSEIINAAGKK